MPLFKSNPRLATIVAGIVAPVIAGGLIWGFGQQLTLARQMQEEEEQLEQAVETERDRYDDLAAQLEYVKSEEYVEYWARTEAHMARLGEVIVVMITDTEEEPLADVQPTPTLEPESQPLWVEFWELVFGS
jgi:cell division protein FtsB